MSVAVDQSLLFLNCLERFEKQSKGISDRGALVEFFCVQVIPFLSESSIIDELRKIWSLQRDQLDRRLQETETRALEEVKAAFVSLQEAVQSPVNEAIALKLQMIEDFISGEKKRYGLPLYQILYNELKRLLEMLARAGHIDLCKKYAKLATYQIYVGTEPDFLLRDETYVKEFFFAPAVLEAYLAREAVHWDSFSDPVVAWWYFESALWCWRTSESYFDTVVRSKNGDDQEKHFKTCCEKNTWQEIASVRNRDQSTVAPVVFTHGLFVSGISSLTNAIHIYFAQGSSYLKRPIQALTQPPTVFELMLNGNELWVKVTFENHLSDKFYVQSFHEKPNLNGSRLHQFVKDIFQNPRAGEKRAKLTDKWESASKHIHRIKLPELLKSKFFIKTHGSYFQFQGLRIELSHNQKEERGLILTELRKRHLTYGQWS